MRINRVNKARKVVGACQVCGKVIGVGEAYKFIKPRYGAQQNRHADHPDWRPSEMTGSDKLARLYGAQENISDVLKGDFELSDVAEALNQAASDARDVAGEYTDAADADEKQGAIYQTNTEKAEQVESWADELESAAGDVEGMEPDETCANCGLMEEEHTDHEFEQRDECSHCGKPEAEHAPGEEVEGKETDHNYTAVDKCAHEGCELKEEDHTDHDFEEDEGWREEVISRAEEARDALEL